MNKSRRNILRNGLGLIAAPTILRLNPNPGYTLAEIDTRLTNGKTITKADLVTPALLLDLDALESNLAKMAAHAKAAQINLRPHGKTHKCVEIARRQLKAGALGICAATIREAEAFAAAGLRGLLITTELVGKPKIERLLKLTRLAPDTMSAVDNLDHAKQLNDAAASAKLKLNIMLDVDPADAAPASRRANAPSRWPNRSPSCRTCGCAASTAIRGRRRTSTPLPHDKRIQPK